MTIYPDSELINVCRCIHKDNNVEWKKQKFIIISLLAILLLFSLSACENDPGNPDEPATDARWGQAEWGRDKWGE